MILKRECLAIGGDLAAIDVTLGVGADAADGTEATGLVALGDLELLVREPEDASSECDVKAEDTDRGDILG